MLSRCNNGSDKMALADEIKVCGCTHVEVPVYVNPWRTTCFPAPASLATYLSALPEARITIGITVNQGVDLITEGRSVIRRGLCASALWRILLKKYLLSIEFGIPSPHVRNISGSAHAAREVFLRHILVHVPSQNDRAVCLRQTKPLALKTQTKPQKEVIVVLLGFLSRLIDSTNKRHGQ